MKDAVKGPPAEPIHIAASKPEVTKLCHVFANILRIAFTMKKIITGVIILNYFPAHSASFGLVSAKDRIFPINIQ
ncbi:hypothetical protein [Erwinia tasmaniensis]|uniref:hypothetical protein n=1 Tax=Erwinia tasmaniensis TaxID=338565 RepID=UPI0005B445CD|nr:hypothetical protein [Erwinia tasmaniensis]